MSPEDLGITAGSTLVSFLAGLMRGKRSHNGNGDSHNGNGHFKEAWAKTVDSRLDVLGEKMDAIGEDLTNLRIDLGAKRQLHIPLRGSLAPLTMPGKIPSTLTNGILAYWKLEEASGNRADSVGSNTLTEVGTPGSATGIIGDGATFTAASNQALTITDNTTLSVGGVSFTWSAWFYKNALGVQQFFLSKGTASGGATTEYNLNVPAANNLQFQTGSGTAAVSINSTGTITASAWHHVVAWYDLGADTINLRLNNAAVRTTAALGRGGYDSAGNFSLGRFHALTTVDWDGRIDEVAFWKRTLTTAEQDELWNGGAGKQYPFS